MWKLLMYVWLLLQLSGELRGCIFWTEQLKSKKGSVICPRRIRQVFRWLFSAVLHVVIAAVWIYLNTVMTLFWEFILALILQRHQIAVPFPFLLSAMAVVFQTLMWVYRNSPSITRSGNAFLSQAHEVSNTQSLLYWRSLVIAWLTAEWMAITLSLT